jgi:hypothetical protein
MIQSTKSVFVLSLLAASTGALAQTHRYTVTFLTPLPGHSDMTLSAINNQGVVVGTSTGSGIANQLPFIYRPGIGVQALPLPPGHQYSVPTDINDNGVIVGYAQPTWADEQSMIAWKYENGVLATYPGITFGNNINNAGTMVGRGCLSGTQLTCYMKAEPGGPMQNFAAANFYSSSNYRLVDINDSGQICYSGVVPGQSQFRLADGTLVPITAAPSPFVRSYTHAVNNSAQVAGRWEYNNGSQWFSRTFIWSQATGATVIGMPRNFVHPKGLNNLGHVVGQSGSNQNGSLDMWIWTPERGTENIEPLVDPAADIDVSSIWGINDAGQIIIRGARLVGGANVTAILTLIPPPCPADLDNGTGTGTRDNAVDISDLLYFLVSFEAGATQADLDNDGNPAVGTPDGGVDINDLLFFLARFEMGC